MSVNPNRPLDAGRARAVELGRRFGVDLKTARIGEGLAQASVARRAGVSQSLVSQVERARLEPSLEVMARLAAAAGCDLVVKLYPAEGIRLRDSGQLAVARLIARRVGSPWRSRFEVPVGHPPDRRAGDVVLDQPAEMVLVEIETGLLDFQSQYRAAQLKRTSLGERVGRPIRLVLALFDTERNRRAVHMHHEVLLQALPVPSRRVWTALRAGLPIAGDGILWVSPRDLK